MLSHLFIAQDASAVVLISWWKALLMLPPFLAWGWLVSSKLDKDARYYHLNQPMWNGIHLSAGVAALAIMLLVPIFWIGWPVGMLVLLTPVLIYWKVRNASVPEDERYHLSSAKLSASLEQRKGDRAARSALIRFRDSNDRERAVPGKEDPLSAVHVAVEDLISPALLARASRLEVALGPNGAAASQMVDGVRYKREAIPADVAHKMFNYLKDIGGLDVEDRRRRQTGRFRLQTPSGPTDVHITTAGSSGGQVLRLDFDRAKRLSRPFDALGLLPSQLEALNVFVERHERHGIILIGAPPGHGLSTSAYSFVSRHDAYTSSIKTVEREILVDVEGVDQIKWDPTNPDLDYATNLQSVLRRDPDLVMASFVKDHDTAKVIIEPGMEGPLIYVPQAIATIPEQIREWVKLCGDVKDAVKALRAVTNQRLMRTLCPNCKQGYQPTADQLKKLGLPTGKSVQLYRPGGKVQTKNKIENCPVCGGSGYLGQVAAFEVLIVDPEIRKTLASGDLKAAMMQARRNKMVLLQEAALSKAVAGETSIEEVVRVTTEKKSKPMSEAKSPEPSPVASS